MLTVPDYTIANQDSCSLMMWVQIILFVQQKYDWHRITTSAISVVLLPHYGCVTIDIGYTIQYEM
jgi:hypothetical protein